MKLYLQIRYWLLVGRVCARLHAIGNRAFAWYQAHSPVHMMVVPPASLSDVEEIHTCGECGARLQSVRPGKYQCPKCE